MKTLFTILVLSLCLGAFGQNIDTVIRIDTLGWTITIAPLPPPDTTYIDGRTIITYPKGYYEKDTIPVWFMVSGSDCCPKHVADSGVHGKMVVVIAGFKVIEREVFRREWDAGNPYPSMLYAINTNSLQWYQYLREDKRPIEGLIIWDTKSR